MALPFIKMHGLGNDFVILDGRDKKPALKAGDIQRIATRRVGIGCDQVIVMEPSQQADVFMRIYNADGGEVQSCGNAARCVAWLVMEEQGVDTLTIETKAGVLQCQRAGDRRVRVDMGKPTFNWQDIPLAKECDTLHLDVTHSRLVDPAAVSMGNPHLVFVVPDVNTVNLAAIGPQLETHPLFPERVNVSVVHVDGKDKITLRVWERGAGLTLACGTAACAAVAVLHKRGLVGDKTQVMLPGGELSIERDTKTGHIFMTGEVATSFHGELP